MAEKVNLEDRKRTTRGLQSWLDDVKKYERSYKKWEGRVDKILKKYRDDSRADASGYTQCKFNILWSNVQTLVPAVYARTPQPDVSRRHRDSDPIGRIASLILERTLEYEVEHYPFYRVALRQCVFDRFLGGRGTSWIRYEPHISAQEGTAADDGVQVTDNAEPEAGEALEQIDYECTPVDYVHWRDYGNNVARTEAEVCRKWRKVYMTRPALDERFGKKISAMVPLDATPEELKNQPDYMPDNGGDRACVYEGWDKETKRAYWFSKSVKDFLDEKDDPLQLEGFFPCPTPLYATLTNESLIPVPDFTLYQDQANSLDVLADRINGLIEALKVTGVYDASITALARLFTEGEQNTLIPVKNWAAFSEKNGLKGAIDVVDISPIAKTLNEAYAAMAQIKEQIYEITGISDIVRGQTEASETLGAQEIKKQFVGLRLGDMKQAVARFASEILQIMAEIICTKYQPETLLKLSAADQLMITESDFAALKLPVPPEALAQMPMEMKKKAVLDAAVQMLKNEPLRNFRIDIEADSMVMLDEQTEKEGAVEFVKAVGGFFDNALPAAQAAPELLPMLVSLLRWSVAKFKVGKTIEGVFDELDMKLKAAAENPKPPPPNPEMAKVEADKQIAQQKLQAEAQAEQIRLQADQQRSQQELQQQDVQHQREMAFKEREMQMQVQADREKHEMTTASNERIGSQKVEAESKPQAVLNMDAGDAMGKIAQSIEQMVQVFTQATQQQAKVLGDALEGIREAAAAPREHTVASRDAGGRIAKTISKPVAH